jgi:hypothetical protein
MLTVVHTPLRHLNLSIYFLKEARTTFPRFPEDIAVRYVQDVGYLIRKAGVG